MLNKIIKSLIKNKLLISIILFLLIVNIYLIITLEKVQKVENVQNYNISDIPPSCLIEYGKPECINSSLLIPFFNPTNFTFENIEISVQTNEGLDKYSVEDPLIPNMLQTLQLFSCYDIENVTVKWCCDEKCYLKTLSEYTNDVTIST
jgi:hypothetical protein